LNPNLWKRFLVGAGLVLGLYLLRLPLPAEGLLYLSIGVGTIVFTLWGLLAHRPYPLAGWILLALGQVLDVSGDWAYIHSVYLGYTDLPQGTSDLIYFAALASFFVGMLVLLVSFRKIIGRGALVNGLIVGTGLAALVWVVQISPNIGGSLAAAEWFDLVAYPAGAVILGILASVILMTPIGSTWSYRFLFFTFVFNTLGLFLYTKAVSQPALGLAVTPWSSIITDASYSIAYIFMSAGFLHPSIVSIRSSMPPRQAIISRRDLALLGGSFLIAPLAFLAEYLRGTEINIPLMLGIIILNFVAVEVRLAQLLRFLNTQNGQLNRQKELLQHQAFHDALTGLPNRLYMYSHLNQAIESSRAGGGRGAVFMIDLNQFKQVNDVFGHDRGDTVLYEIARQMVRLKRKGDTVARWGGDEFVFILEDLDDMHAALAFARRLNQEVSYTASSANQSVCVTLSIGICPFPGDHANIDAILKDADAALYRAKASTAERIAFGPLQAPETI
jgi:diguanylate cyclase (GGDEF)-like protein